MIRSEIAKILTIPRPQMSEIEALEPKNILYKNNNANKTIFFHPTIRKFFAIWVNLWFMSRQEKMTKDIS